MTAVQVINEIKAMTPEERGQVIDFLRQYEKSPQLRVADDATIDKLGDQIMDRHADLMRKLAS